MHNLEFNLDVYAYVRAKNMTVNSGTRNEALNLFYGQASSFICMIDIVSF